MPYVKLFLLMIFLAIAVSILAIGLLALLFKNRAHRRSKRRNEILQKRASSSDAAVWIPIRYSSQRYFQRMWKFWVWEKSGVLFLDKGSIFFVSDEQIDQSLVLTPNPSESNLNWVGAKFWPNGFVHWFTVVANGETHYFTSETGTFIFTSRKSTESVYNQLREHAEQAKSAYRLTAVSRDKAQEDQKES
jgi:hypothetical protein